MKGRGGGAGGGDLLVPTVSDAVRSQLHPTSVKVPHHPPNPPHTRTPNPKHIKCTKFVAFEAFLTMLTNAGGCNTFLQGQGPLRSACQDVGHLDPQEAPPYNPPALCVCFWTNLTPKRR